MRKSSVLLGFIALACALSATWSAWQLGAERERVAALAQQLDAARAANTPQPESAAPVVAGPVQPATPVVPTAKTP